MSRLEAILATAVRALEAQDVRFAVIGGIAVSARAEPRFTRDLDLAVAVADDREAEALVHALTSQGFRPIASVEQTATHRLATVRLAPPGELEDGVVVDLLFASSGIEDLVVAGAELLEIFAGMHARVACVGHLVALKLLARDDVDRPQDQLDLRALAPLLDADELERARTAVRTIEARGYSRGRSLVAALEALHGTSRSRE